jgi:hypothetical protein
MVESTDRITLRIGQSRKETVNRLSQLAGYEKTTHFIKALIDQLGDVDKPFDVRDIKCPTRAPEQRTKKVSSATNT